MKALQTLALAGALGLTMLGRPAVAQGQPACAGSTATVLPGDTVSAIAERCGTSERAILLSNPNVDGSADLQVGSTIDIRRPGEDHTAVADRLTHFGREANQAVGEVAGKLGSSVQDLLDRNPDLKSRLSGLGAKLGLTDGERPEPRVTITPQSVARDGTVTISASGLPKESLVTVGIGRPGSAFQAVTKVQSSATGTIETAVTVPDALSSSSSLVVVLKSESGMIEARSEPIRIGPQPG